MSDIEGYTEMEEEWGEGEVEVDDKLLCDLHLNSPLNIDHVRGYLGEKIKYRLNVDDRFNRSADKGIASLREACDYYGSAYDPVRFEAGCLPVKLMVCKLSQYDECWNEPEWPTMLRAIDGAFHKRRLHTRFSIIADRYDRGGIRYPKGLSRAFTCIMTLCLGVSETIRGGQFPNALGGNILTNGRWSSLCMRTPDLGDIFISTDGTSVHMYHQGVHYITVWEDLLSILDMLGQRISSFTAHEQAESLEENGSIPSKLHKEIITNFDNVLKRYGNEGYDLIGMFETLCVSTLLQKNPDGINDPLLLTANLYTEIEEMAEKLGTSKQEVGDIFDKLFALLFDLDNHQLSNLFCEYRIWGNPYVDVYEGMKKVYSVGTKRKNISKYLPSYMVRIFKEHVVNGVYRKNGRYPKGLVENIRHGSEGYISECIRHNKSIEKYSPGYTLEDWDDIELCEMFPIPTTYDITHILNDKAISPKLSELIAAVNNNIPFNRMDGRRGILAWLQGNTISCRDLLQEISKNGIGKEDCVIGLSEKEREIKIAARMFALMSEIMRYYFVITEGLIADYLLEFFPQITMKDSLNKLQKRLWTAGSKHGGSYDTNINIDFSKWNTNMRAELMTPLFEEMDRLFGLRNVISRTHQIFTSSLIYSCSGKYQAEASGGDIVEDAPMCYRGHLGGMEGLRQKGWTIGTVCLIEYVALLVRIKYGLMGQGDNQIIKLKMPEHKWREYEWGKEAMVSESSKYSDKFVTMLETTFGEVGLPVKPRECWRSHRLFMYGKAMLLDNKVLAQWCKKILRSYALSNEGILTVGGTIGTISSNCMSACVSMINPELGYSLYLQMGLWTLRFLTKYHPFPRAEHIHDMEILFRIPGERRDESAPKIQLSRFFYTTLLIPSICGGSTNIPFTTYIMRGFPDPASEAYSWLKLLKEGPSDKISIIASNYYSYIIPKEISLEQLAVSPLSLNHVKALAPSLSASRESVKFLRDNFSGKNNVVRCEMRVSESYSGVHVADALATDPLNPLLLHELHGLYPHSVMSDLISRISSTSTIKKLSIKSASTPIIKRIQRAEITYMGYLRWRGGVSATTFSKCATAQVRSIRDVGWGREITGVTTPHPLECIMIGCSDVTKCDIDSDSVYILRDDRGGFSPYLGSSIKNKVQGVGDKQLRGEPLIRGVARMASYANWLGLGKNHRSLIRELGTFYGGESVSKLIDEEYNADGNYTGSMDHRLRTGMTAEGCFINYAPQVGENIFMSTDNMLTYGRGNTNYTLQFQAVFCWTQIMAQRTSILHHGHAHVVCTDCVVPVTDIVPDISDVNHTVLGVLRDDIRGILGLKDIPHVEYHGEASGIITQFCERALNKETYTKSTLRLSITISLAIRVSRELMSDALEDAREIGTEIADLQKYPRIYGKKIYTDEFFEYLAMFCIIRGCISKDLAAEGVPLFKVKRYIIDRLSHLPYSKMAGLGSLVIEHNISDYNAYLDHCSFGAAYPTTIHEHMLGGISTLKRIVQSVGSMEKFILPRKIDIPMIDFRNDDLAIYIICVDLIKNKCMKMLGVYRRMRDSSDMLRESCTQQHAVNILSCLNPINGSIDKMVKYLCTLETPPIDFYPVRGTIIPDTYPIQVDYKSPVRGRLRSTRGPISFSPRDHREITMPTASVYKWDEFLGAMKFTKYNIILGDGTGTSSYTLAVNNPKCFFFPMSLLEKKNITPQDLGALKPAMSKWVNNVRQDCILNVRDDVKAPDFISSLKTFLSGFPAEEITIISDIEMEGGGLLSQDVLADLIGMGYPCYIKGYTKEFYKNDTLGNSKLSVCNVIYSSVGNVQYGELLLHMVQGHEHIDPYDIIVEYEVFRETFDQTSSTLMTHHISEKYYYLRSISLNLSIRHLESLGWSVTKDILLLSWDVLSMYLVVFINTHYHFIAEGGSGNRRISPRKRRDIERLFTILFLITTDRSFSPLSISNLKMMHRKDGIFQGYPFKKGVFLVEGNNTEVKKKDIQVANCIKGYRIRNGKRTRKIDRIGEMLSENTSELLGILNKQTMSEALYQCSETFETGTTLSEIRED